MSYLRDQQLLMESEEEQVPEPAQQSQGRNAFLSWKFKQHFTLKKEKGERNITVQCNLCLPATNLLSASKDSTSNLKKHLKVNVFFNQPRVVICCSFTGHLAILQLYQPDVRFYILLCADLIAPEPWKDSDQPCLTCQLTLAKMSLCSLKLRLDFCSMQFGTTNTKMYLRVQVLVSNTTVEAFICLNASTWFQLHVCTLHL